jgi:hypothetical protein
MKFRTIYMLMCVSIAFAQSQVDLSRQARNVDFSAQPHTRPIQTGTALPASCNVGELFFNTGATNGNSIFACTAANTWTPVGGGSLGLCSVTNSALFCPDSVQTGTGAQAGEISLYEILTNGNNSVSVSAPNSITASYTLLLPGSVPQAGQTLTFAAPDSNGNAQGSWTTAGTSSQGGLNGTSLSLSGSGGSASNSVTITAPAAIPGSYTLQLPSTPPLSGQSLVFGVPDVNDLSQASWQSPGQSSGGGATFEGVYAGLPASCSEGSLYLFTDSLYPFARCTSGVWLYFFDGKAITPPSSLSLTSLILTAPVTLSDAHGYEQIAAPGGSSIALRAFPSPASAPYTKYLVLRTPQMLDQGNYRFWHAGFADDTGKSQVLSCGVGVAAENGFWCRLTRLSAAGGYVGQDSPNIVVPYFSGTVVVALENDGTLLHFGVSTDGNSFFELGNVPIASYLSSPSSLVYGFESSAAGQNLALNFLGVY